MKKTKAVSSLSKKKHLRHTGCMKKKKMFLVEEYGSQINLTLPYLAEYHDFVYKIALNF